MQLTLVNCSPRGKTSNTERIFSHFISGFTRDKRNLCENVVLSKNEEGTRRSVINSNNIIFGVPLYTDAMPGEMLSLIVSLESYANQLKGKSFGFIIHSGYPESIHSMCLERYFERLTKKLKINYAGTIIIGLSESLRLKPPITYGELVEEIASLGEYYSKNVKLFKKKTSDNKSISCLNNKSYHNAIGFLNKFWDFRYKESGTYDVRYRNPYEKDGIT